MTTTERASAFASCRACVRIAVGLVLIAVLAGCTTTAPAAPTSRTAGSDMPSPPLGAPPSTNRAVGGVSLDGWTLTVDSTAASDDGSPDGFRAIIVTLAASNDTSDLLGFGAYSFRALVTSDRGSTYGEGGETEPVPGGVTWHRDFYSVGDAFRLPPGSITPIVFEFDIPTSRVAASISVSREGCTMEPCSVEMPLPAESKARRLEPRFGTGAASSELAFGDVSMKLGAASLHRFWCGRPNPQLALTIDADFSHAGPYASEVAVSTWLLTDRYIFGDSNSFALPPESDIEEEIRVRVDSGNDCDEYRDPGPVSALIVLTPPDAWDDPNASWTVLDLGTPKRGKDRPEG